MWAVRWLAFVAATEAAIFQPSGKVHLTKGNLLVTATINVRPFKRRCQDTLHSVASIRTTINSPEDHIKKHIRQVVNDTCQQINGWPGLEDRRRSKRQLLAMAGAVFGGIAVELWHRWTGTSTKELEHHVAQQDRRLLELARITQKLQGYIERQEQETIRIEALLELALVARQYERTIDGITRGISLLVAVQKVTTDILPPKVAETVWGQVQAALRRKGHHEVQLPPALLYECRASYFYDSNTISIVFEVPVIHDSYELFHKTRHPTWLPGHKKPMIIGEQGYLAVSKGGHNFVTPRAELAGCSEMGPHKFCPLEVARSDWSDHCLGALFKGLWKEALARCPIKNFEGRWAAERLSQERFDVVVTEATPFRVICGEEASEVRNGRWQPGQHNVTVEASCTLSAAVFSLHAAVSGGVRFAIQPPAGWLSPEETLKALEQRRAARQEEELGVARRVEEEVGSLEEEERWRPSSPPTFLAVGVAMLAALAVGMVWLRRRRRQQKKKKRPAANNSSAGRGTGAEEIQLAAREMDD
jgi:MYXO-CTERM domain-containing protein